jgi:hypothetical protein
MLGRNLLRRLSRSASSATVTQIYPKSRLFVICVSVFGLDTILAALRLPVCWDLQYEVVPLLLIASVS